MASNDDLFRSGGFDDDSVQERKRKEKEERWARFTGQTGYYYRVAFPTESVLRAFTHFHDDGTERFRFVCPDHTLCCKHYGAPKEYFGVPIVVYGTDKRGRLQKPFEYEVLPWVFTDNRYIEIGKLKKIMGGDLTSQDVVAFCKDGRWQQFELDPVKDGKAIWSMKQEIKDEVLKKVASMDARIKRLLGRVLDADQIRDLLDIEDEDGGGLDPSSDIPFDEMLA